MVSVTTGVVATVSSSTVGGMNFVSKLCIRSCISSSVKSSGKDKNDPSDSK